MTFGDKGPGGTVTGTNGRKAGETVNTMHRSSLLAGALLVLLAATGMAMAGPAAAATPPPRHIGSSTVDEVRSAAGRSAAEHAGCYGLTATRLEATALAIVFKETGSGFTYAPSPMTLSRYDVYKPDGGTFQRLNYGLYAFRDPNTAYQRAFWHPGVGVWQLDEAGLGKDYTAAERISSHVSTSYIVDYLGDRWCSPGSPSSIKAGRDRAWADWGCRQSTSSANCERLESIYLELYSDGGLDRLIIDPISDLGGGLARTCRMGDGQQLPCTYVDPGRAQGDTWWRSTSLSGATPIAHPFYVIEHNGYELYRRTENEVGLLYSYDLENGPDGLTLVYNTPSLIMNLPVAFEIKDIDYSEGVSLDLEEFSLD